jgi:hypothetical protein
VNVFVVVPESNQLDDSDDEWKFEYGSPCKLKDTILIFY